MKLLSALLSVILLFSAGAALSAGFDERLWEKYAEIQPPPIVINGGLAGIQLDPYRFTDFTGKSGFADFRVVNDRKEEVPWQIVTKRPEKRREEVPVRMLNLSRTESGETWLELVVEKPESQVNGVEIITPDTDFSRQVQVLGGPDGKTWNTMRNDGVVFDTVRGDRLRYTRISFPETTFPHLALKITNGNAPPLDITSVKIFQEIDFQGHMYSISGIIQPQRPDAAPQESSIIVRTKSGFPVDRLLINTAERNFQRSVDVQIKGNNGQWQQWTQGNIFSFDAPGMHETQLAVEIPEVTADEFRLVFRNYDSPPLSITGVTAQGYSRILVFKQQPDRKLYLFWGNPAAHQPRYDLAGLVMKQRVEDLPMTTLGRPYPNMKFAGNDARLPFTERYKHALYALVTLVIVGLVVLQYRVVRRVRS